MVILLPKAERGNEFGRAVGESLGQGYMQGRQKRERLASQDKENKLIKERFGIDLSGITNPEDRKAILGEQLKGKGKQDIFNQKQNFLEQIYNRGEPQQEEEDINPHHMASMAAQLAGGGFKQQKEQQQQQQEQEPNEFDASNMTEEQIAYASSIDQNLGRLLQSQKEAADRKKHEAELFDFKKKTAVNKDISDSFKENQDYINNVFDKYEDAERREGIFSRMDQLEESGQLSESGVINLLESLGIKPEWLKNPANEEYTKLALDLLGGGTLQADYGSRIFASEFKVSQQRIPGLLQTAEGRKQIKENLRVALLPALLKKERLQYYLDKAERTGEPLPHNLRGKILKDIKPQLEEAYDTFKQRNGRYKVKEGTSPDDNAIEKYYYISDGNKEKAKKMMKDDGYDIN